MRMQILRDGLNGQVADGILVRASTVTQGTADAAAAYATQDRFLAQLVAAVKPGAPALVAAPH